MSKHKLPLFISLSILWIIVSLFYLSKLLKSPDLHIEIEDTTHNYFIGDKRLETCWFQIFNKLFVTSALNHSFSTSYDEIVCDIININILLLETDRLLRKYITRTSSSSMMPLDDEHLFNYRSLISIRRIIMLLNSRTDINMDNKLYDHILIRISQIEFKYIQLHRNNYPIFNIHLPRSAGTFMCAWFEIARRKQVKLTSDEKYYQHTINPYPKSNCNAGDGDPFQYFPVYMHKTSKTCDQQYEMMNNHSMIARESPLYPNKNKYEYKHPLLCDKFVYVLSFRSPIERIISWLTADTRLSFKQKNGTWMQPKGGEWYKYYYNSIGKILPNFYSSLYDYKLNSKYLNIIKLKNNRYIDFIAFLTGAQFTRTYSSNAVTKWIGFEFDSQPVSMKDIIEGLLIATDDFNTNDVHFYNAIQLLLKIDFVLNFSSYFNDESAINLHQFEDILSQITHIGDGDSMWSIFAKQMNDHFNISSSLNLFNFNDPKWSASEPKHARWINHLTSNDMRTLRKQNYFDFRLYALAKHINNVDHYYYSQIYPQK